MEGYERLEEAWKMQREVDTSGKRIGFVLPWDAVHRFEGLARVRGLTVSGYVRMLIFDELRRLGV